MEELKVHTNLDTTVLNQIYEFPDAWDDPPRVYRLVPGWEAIILQSDGLMRIDGSTTIAPPSTYKSVAPSEVIFIETASGELKRRSGPLMIRGEWVEIKREKPAENLVHDRGFLYRYLIREKREAWLSWLPDTQRSLEHRWQVNR